MARLSSLNPWLNGPNTERMPVLFLGHGSPMNAIEENEFVAGFRQQAALIPKPKAILCVSAHWMTRGTEVTAMASPRTIHDFGGFPPELYEVQYPAPGQPDLASALPELLNPAQVGLDQNWGLDHGAWSVIKHLYRQADIPVVQMSLDVGLSPLGHAELAARLAELRNKGVLIIGSGNTVHNLGRVAWDRLNEVGYAYDWAEEARLWINQNVQSGNLQALCQYEKQGAALRLAVPTSEHYLPLLYSLAVCDAEEPLAIFNDKALAGSLAMTSFRMG